MVIEGKGISKKYGKSWIFRDLDFIITNDEKTAITGKNGAGKSTLLQLIAGFLTPSKGKILFDNQAADEHPHSAAFVGPYTEIIQEFTLRELLKFHANFKKPLCNFEQMADKASLPLDKIIDEFSTGMKQRTQLITAFYFENNILFLDEPTSNLDEQGFRWWMDEINKNRSSIIIIASNDQKENNVCQNSILL